MPVYLILILRWNNAVFHSLLRQYLLDHRRENLARMRFGGDTNDDIQLCPRVGVVMSVL